MEYCTDNAAMIGCAAYYELKNKRMYSQKIGENYKVDAISTKGEWLSIIPIKIKNSNYLTTFYIFKIMRFEWR